MQTTWLKKNEGNVADLDLPDTPTIIDDLLTLPTLGNVSLFEEEDI